MNLIGLLSADGAENIFFSEKALNLFPKNILIFTPYQN